MQELKEIDEKTNEGSYDEPVAFNATQSEKSPIKQEFDNKVPKQQFREDIVNDAVDFLSNPKIVSAATASKRKFLSQRKGLSDLEIDEAFRRSGIILNKFKEIIFF